MADVNLTAGDEAEDVIAGKGNQQSRQQANPHQRTNQRSDPSNNMYFSGQQDSSNMNLWLEVMRLAARIQELTAQMDNLPNRVDQLERTEVIVKPGPEVMIRQGAVAAPATDAIVLSANTLLKILYITIFVIACLGAYLIWLNVH